MTLRPEALYDPDKTPQSEFSQEECAAAIQAACVRKNGFDEFGLQSGDLTQDILCSQKQPPE
jgi:hypothetical protein